MQEHGIGGNGHIAGTGAARREPGEGKNQAQGADHDVAIGAQGAQDFFTVPDLRPGRPGFHLVDGAPNEKAAEQGR